MAMPSNWVIDANIETFQRDVIEQSLQRPVVVDLWAPWCGPCRQLGPVLEKLAQESNGKFVLAKVNVEEEQELAAAFGVSSIPHVVAFRDGQPIDQFQGLLPEDQIRQWLSRFMPSPADDLVRQGETLEATDPAAASQCYRQALELSPDDDSIKIRLARTLLARNLNDECRHVLDELEARGYLEPEAETIKSQLDLREAAAEAGGVEEARKAVAAAPDDLALQVKLADALAVAGKHREALDICLQVIERDKHGVGVEAKDAMVKIFDLLGSGSSLVSEYRRKLATMLY